MATIIEIDPVFGQQIKEMLERDREIERYREVMAQSGRRAEAERQVELSKQPGKPFSLLDFNENAD